MQLAWLLCEIARELATTGRDQLEKDARDHPYWWGALFALYVMTLFGIIAVLGPERPREIVLVLLGTILLVAFGPGLFKIEDYLSESAE